MNFKFKSEDWLLSYNKDMWINLEFLLEKFTSQISFWAVLKQL
ncbi:MULTISPECIES: hypothetical protein [Campylobacter]|nr:MULTISPECIES: hypothetical protein [Campylobacter]